MDESMSQGISQQSPPDLMYSQLPSLDEVGAEGFGSLPSLLELARLPPASQSQSQPITATQEPFASLLDGLRGSNVLRSDNTLPGPVPAWFTATCGPASQPSVPDLFHRPGDAMQSHMPALMQPAVWQLPVVQPHAQLQPQAKLPTELQSQQSMRLQASLLKQPHHSLLKPEHKLSRATRR